MASSSATPVANNGETMASVLAVLASLAISSIAGDDACNNVPTMTWGDACLKACNEEPWYRLCPEMLRNGPDTATATVYALIAARQAKLKYDRGHHGEMDQALEGGGGSSSSSLPGGEREAVSQCKDLYAGARGLIAGVAGLLLSSGCDFTRARKGYVDVVSGVTSCQSRLRPFKGSLSAMVTADPDLTMVAYDLGA